MPRFVALLRAVRHEPMAPYRAAFEDLGFAGVATHGASGNVLFTAARGSPAALERRIAARLGRPAFVRTRAELGRAVAGAPWPGRSDAAVLFLARAPTAARRRSFRSLDFDGPAPVLDGRLVWYRDPVRLAGRRTPLDLERALGVQGTFRSARVVAALHRRLAAPSVGS